MGWKNAMAVAAAALAVLLAQASLAAADSVVGSVGEGAGQVREPGQLAVNESAGTLYVADSNNNRIDVFDAEGNFVKAFGWGVSTGSSTFQSCTASCRAGIAGSGSGQFSRPSGIAVDNDAASPSFGSVYVYDFDNRRVQKFTSAGAFALTFGGGVNKTKGADVCVAGSGDICGAGSTGTGAGEFGLGKRPIATGPEGFVYVGDSMEVAPENPEEGAQTVNRVQRFVPGGAFDSQFPLPSGGPVKRVKALAVNSAERVFVNVEVGPADILEYNAEGQLESTLGGVDDVTSLAVDAEDDLFVAERTDLFTVPINAILELDSSNQPVRRFGYDFPARNTEGMAPWAGPDGDIYASELDGRVVAVSFPPPGPVVVPRPCVSSFVGNTRAEVACGINPEGEATTVHFQYIDQAGFEAGGFVNPATEETPESESIGDDFALHTAPLTLEGLQPETTYHYRVVATNADGGPVVGPESTFTTKPPLELGPSWTAAVGETTALLRVEANPLSLPTTGFFEYVDDAGFEASGFAGASQAPDVAGGAGPIDFGESEGFVVREAELSGLAPGTGYHYRVSVRDSFLTVHGPEHTFTTAAAGAPGLPDARGYELVSPVEKGSAEIGNPGPSQGLNDSGYTRIQQGAPGGDAFTFTSFTSFGDPQSAPGASQYLARRSASGWGTRNITPPGHSANPLRPPFRGFSAGLDLGAVAVEEPPLTPEADPDHQNLYLQDSDTGALQLVSEGTPVVSPAENDPYCVGFGGASASTGKVVFEASGALTPQAPVTAGSSLYEWTKAGGVKLLSVLPGEVAAQSSSFNGFGAKGVSGCGLGETVVRHAVSADGSKVFWTYVPKTGATRLIARVNGTESVQVDAKQGGTGNAGGGVFRAASADGSKVVFIDSSKLVPGAKGGDLYRYDFGKPLGERLASLTGAPEAAGVQGVLGADEAADRVYFVATGVLAENANSEGAHAVSGGQNVYLWQAGAGNRFIATLDLADNEDWSEKPFEQRARVSPDGGSLGFLSRRSLTGYDNAVQGAPGCVLSDEGQLGGDPRCAEAFVYDLGPDQLTCASCNPRGARPIGPATVPGWSSPFQQPRYLSADNGRLFFSSMDSLDLADVNGRADIYEWERTGRGSCEAGSPSFSADAGGCVQLISSGTAADDAFLWDASEDGDDVFFSTRQRLVGQDIDERYDLYDARVDGGFAPPQPEAEECGGEACRPEAEPAPAAGAPGSGVTGPGGNVKESRGGAKPKTCRKGTHKVRRGGKVRCVRNASKGHKRRRAGR